jgi:hypothetical protein
MTPSSRRKFLQVATGAALATFATPTLSQVANPHGGKTFNGSNDPFPIPWLDKNGSHNQPAEPNLEPSHIYDFKGKVARCAGFTGMGTDKKGTRIAFGTATTDYGVMEGEYFAARQPRRGSFTHI